VLISCSALLIPILLPTLHMLVTSTASTHLVQVWRLLPHLHTLVLLRSFNCLVAQTLFHTHLLLASLTNFPTDHPFTRPFITECQPGPTCLALLPHLSKHTIALIPSQRSTKVQTP
jgi:hypothetical protein